MAFYPGEMGEGDPPGPTVTGCFRKIHHEGTKGTKRAKEAESLAPEGFFSFLPPAFPCLLSALCAFVVKKKVFPCYFVSASTRVISSAVRP